MPINLDTSLEQLLADAALEQAQLKLVTKPTALDMTSPETRTQLNTIMSDLMGGQKNQLDDYVRRAALTGVQRGGYNVRGVPNYAGSLQREAVNALASGYQNRYQTALDYLKYMNDAQLAMWGKAQDALANQMGITTSGLGLQQKETQNLRELADAEAQRGWQSGENTLARDLQKYLQENQQNWQSGESLAERDWKSQENVFDREQQRWMQDDQQAWQGGQNAQQRALEEKLKKMGIDADMARQIAQQEFQGGENAADRAAQKAEADAQREWADKDREDTQAFDRSMVPPSGGGGGSGGGGSGSGRPGTSPGTSPGTRQAQEQVQEQAQEEGLGTHSHQESGTLPMLIGDTQDRGQRA